MMIWFYFKSQKSSCFYVSVWISFAWNVSFKGFLSLMCMLLSFFFYFSLYLSFFTLDFVASTSLWGKWKEAKEKNCIATAKQTRCSGSNLSTTRIYSVTSASRSYRLFCGINTWMWKTTTKSSFSFVFSFFIFSVWLLHRL